MRLLSWTDSNWLQLVNISVLILAAQWKHFPAVSICMKMVDGNITFRFPVLGYPEAFDWLNFLPVEKKKQAFW